MLIGIPTIDLKMKGKNIFTLEEAIIIKQELENLKAAGRYSIKDYRIKLRNDLKFYISDFVPSKKGLSAEGFDQLVAEGKIRIEKDPK